MSMNEKEVNQEEREGFKIDSDDLACWALKKIKKMQDEIDEKKALADRQKYQIEQWLEEETGKRKKNIEYLESLLQEYGYQLKTKDPKLKTHSLPFGDLKFRKQQPKWEYEDDKLLSSVKKMNWGNDVIQVKEKVDKRELKSIIKTEKNQFKITDGKIVDIVTGEIIEGVTVTDRPEKFEVKVK